MFLVKNPNGRYYVVYEKPNGKRTSISTKTKNKSEAYKFLSNFNNELKKKLSEKVILIDLKQFFFEFLKHSESIHSWNTTKSIISTKKAILKYFGNVQLTDVTKPKIIEYLDFRIRTASIYVGRRELAYLSGAFNWAISRNYLNDNPTKGIKRFRVPEKQPLFYSKGDIDELLNVIDNTDIQDLINFALHTGLRQMELLNLEWNQIDFVNRNVFLNNINHMTKSQKIRTIPLDSKAFEILIKRGERDRNIKVFTINNEPIKQQFISHKMKKYIKKAGLNPNLNFHSLRHTFASWLVQKGADINRVSKLLGHSDIKTTEIYAHLRPEDLRNTVSLLDN